MGAPDLARLQVVGHAAISDRGYVQSPIRVLFSQARNLNEIDRVAMPGGQAKHVHSFAQRGSGVEWRNLHANTHTDTPNLLQKACKLQDLDSESMRWLDVLASQKSFSAVRSPSLIGGVGRRDAAARQATSIQCGR